MGLADTADPGHAFAEKLGGWIHFADAIALSAVHGGSLAGTPERRAAAHTAPAVQAAMAEFDRVQAALLHAVSHSCASGAGKMHIPLPAPPAELPLDVAAASVPYRRFYEAHQRDMELRIPPLRARVRAAAAQASPALRKLAELDAALEKILRERERQLLARLPALLRKRFEQLFNEHQQQLAAAEQPDHPAGWMQAGGWLARFCGDLQLLLLAEVELRLQPALGLIEACKHDTQ